MKHIKTSVLALLCAFAGMTNFALAADKTVTYTFSAERDNYSNRWTLTFTPSSAGFGAAIYGFVCFRASEAAVFLYAVNMVNKVKSNIR